jgi:hypothetical protein
MYLHTYNCVYKFKEHIPMYITTVHPHTTYRWPISKHKNVMARTRKYYFKNNYLTLRSKVKVPQRPLWYVTHCLMVIHPHTIYHWPISKDKNVMAQTRKYYLKNNYLTSRSKFHEGHFGTGNTALWSCIHFVFWDRSTICGMWVHDHKVVYCLL